MATGPLSHLPMPWPGFVTGQLHQQKQRQVEGNQADSFFTTRFYLLFLDHPPNNKVVHLSFIFNGFPFGSKRAFILQDVHLTNMHCWAPALGETHRYSGWASFACCSITTAARVSGWYTPGNAALNRASHGCGSQMSENVGGSIFYNLRQSTHFPSCSHPPCSSSKIKSRPILVSQRTEGMT